MRTTPSIPNLGFLPISSHHTQIPAVGHSISAKQVASKRFKMRRKMKLVWEFLQERRKSINFVN